MEMDQIQTQACKLSRIVNSRNDSNKIGRKGGDQYQDEDEEDGEGKGGGNGATGTDNAIVGGFDVGSENGRLRAWHSSRIFRVSRASGGKDRHSKVLTARGLRDRRVRLSVSTAIQFYDLQDRLGYDQPSKAVEWLIKAAADAITELPSLNTAFPDTPKQQTDEKRSNNEPRFDTTEIDLDTDPSYQQQQQQHNISLSKSACSSTSETSKGSVLSLSRSEIRVKARERARERTSKDKEKEKPDEPHHSTPHQQNSQGSSFTELLTGCAHNTRSNPSLSAAQQNPSFSNFVIKQNRHIPSTHQMDYFTAGLFGSSSMRNNPYSSGFSDQTHFGNASPTPLSMAAPPPPQFSVTPDHHQEQHQFFLSDHIPDAAASVAVANDYNLNFTIASGIAGFNRGTLQSNSSQSPLPHHLQQRFSSLVDGPNMPFFMGNVGAASTVAAAAAPTENQFPSRFDSGLQLYYGHEDRHPDFKGKGKS